MKATLITLATLLVLASSSVYAQSQNPQSQIPSGRGSTTGDPAASSANPAAAPATTGSNMKPSRSGSGTSTSGGSDANGDQGRDKMPETANRPTIPLDQQNKPAVGR
jgi:ABC-type phosphate transport system substrate-binding protein